MKPVFTCRPDEDVHKALKLMRQHQIRRMPVVGEDGKLSGIVCLDQIVLHAEKAEKTAGVSYEDVVNTMKAICEHRVEKSPQKAAMAAGQPIAA